jgi:hypothetical protein
LTKSDPLDNMTEILLRATFTRKLLPLTVTEFDMLPCEAAARRCSLEIRRK